MSNILRENSFKDKYLFSGKNSFLIGVSGKKRSGKDTFFEYANKISSQRGVNFENRKFADNLKKICSILSGENIDVFQDHTFYNNVINSYNLTVRELLQIVGTEVFRDSFDKNVWVKSLFNTYKPNQNWIVTDVRFPNEANAIKKRGGILIRINRDLLNDEDKHESETALDDYNNFDYIISNNDSLESYRNNIIKIITEIGIR